MVSVYKIIDNKYYVSYGKKTLYKQNKTKLYN